MKRIFDLTVSFSVLLALSPLLALLALIVRIKHGSPVVFRQFRPGLCGKPFACLKFRSMTEEKNADGELLPDQQRITRLGVFLRKTSLDELPELWNVVKGEMSLVGPRPLRMEYLPLYNKEQARRHNVKPGITGWAQINGRNEISWEEKFNLDLWYVDNQSFYLDLKILIITLYKVLKREGINADSGVPMPKFTGSEDKL